MCSSDLADHSGFSAAPLVIGSVSGFNFQLIGNRASIDLIPNKPGPNWDLQAGPVAVLDLNRSLLSYIDDPRVRVQTIFSSSTPASPMDSPLYCAIRESVEAICPGAAVVPSVSTGFTDSRVFRRRGIPAYGFMPLLLEPPDMGTVHGKIGRAHV